MDLSFDLVVIINLKNNGKLGLLFYDVFRGKFCFVNIWILLKLFVFLLLVFSGMLC